MTIEYTLFLDAALEPRAVTDVLAAELGVAHAADGVVSITAWRLNRKYGLAEDHGVDAKLGVCFQLHSEESEEAKKPMLRDLLIVLREIPGDAVFVNVADEVLLVRRSGLFEPNLAAHFWQDPKLRALLDGALA